MIAFEHPACFGQGDHEGCGAFSPAESLSTLPVIGYVRCQDKDYINSAVRAFRGFARDDDGVRIL
jgi:hypothetical protein